MSIALLNEKARPPRDHVPICTQDMFDHYWKPGAEALGLALVQSFGYLAISSKKGNTDHVGTLVEELGKLRAWFQKNVPPGNQKALFERLDTLVRELKLISQDEEIDISI